MQLPDLSQADTTAKLLLHNAARFGGEVALREKAYGIWHVYSWADLRRPRRASWRRGSSRWASAAATWSASSAATGPTGSGPSSRRTASARCRSGSTRTRSARRWSICSATPRPGSPSSRTRSRPTSCSRSRASCRRCAGSSTTIRAACGSIADRRLLSREQLIEQGRSEPAGRFEQVVAAGRGDEVAVLCTTSGTTAHPKLAMLQHRPLLEHVVAYLRAEPREPTDEYVSILPLPWIVEQVYVAIMPLLSRIRVNFPEDEKHGDARSARDRADPRAVRAAGVGADLGRRPRPAARRQPAQPGDLQPRGQGGAEGAGRGAPLLARRSRPVRRAARSPGPLARQVGGDRRLGARPRHLPLLPRHGRAAAPALRPDRGRRRLYHPDRRRARLRQLRHALRRHRDPDPRARQRRARRGLGAPSAACSRATSSSRKRPARR